MMTITAISLYWGIVTIDQQSCDVHGQVSLIWMHVCCGDCVGCSVSKGALGIFEVCFFMSVFSVHSF